MKSPSEKADSTVEKDRVDGLPALAEVKQAKILPVYRIPLHLLEEAPWNPMEGSAKSLNNLTENIREVGFAETAMVIPLSEYTFEAQEGQTLSVVTSGKFRILSGHDRAKAALASGLTEMPCSVAEGLTEELQKLITVRANVIRKKMNPAKFVKLFQDLSTQYGDEVVKTMMMFTDQSQLEHMLASVRKSMPEAMRGELDKKKHEIKTVDDLASVVSEIFNRAGSTLDRGFIVFSYGGQQHVYVSCSKPLAQKVQKIVDRAEMENRHITEIFEEELGIAT